MSQLVFIIERKDWGDASMGKGTYSLRMWTWMWISSSSGKVRHGRLSYNPSPGQQKQADHEDSLPGQPPYLKVVMERVVEEKSASDVAFIAASQWESLSQGNKMERVEKITLILLWPPHSHAWVHTPACTKWVCYTWGEMEGGEIEMTKKEQNQEW